MKKTLFLIGILIICGFGMMFLINKKDEMINSESKNVLSTKTTISQSPKVEKSEEFVQNAYHPIVFAVKDDDGSYSSASLIGGAKDGNWVSIVNQEIKIGRHLITKDCSELPEVKGEPYAEVDMAKGGETYRFYSFKEYLASNIGMKPILSINGYTLDKILDVKLKPFKVANPVDLIIGINAKWNALPRIPKVIDSNTVIVDLDNDGKTEKIVREEMKNEDEQTTEVSFVVEKQTKKLPLGEHPTQIDGDKYKECYLMSLDLNGDGKMELIKYRNGSNRALTVYELKNDKMVSVLGYYYGD